VQKANISILSSLLLLVLAVTLGLYQHEFYGAATGFVATMLAMGAEKKYTRRIDTLFFIGASIITMFILNIATGKPFSFFLITGIAFPLGFNIRNFLYKELAYNGLPYLEVGLSIISIGAYVTANILTPIGWQGWVIPAGMALLSVYGAYGAWASQVAYKEKGLLAKPLLVGSMVGHFALPDQNGKLFDTAALKNVSHYLLVFIRGDWCPACHVKIRTYYNEREKFKAKNIQVVMISPDPIDVNSDMMDRLAADFTILSDEKFEAGKTFNVVCHDNYPMTKYTEGIPLPSAFLVDKNGILRYASTPEKLGEYLDPRTIFPIIDSL
jgi:peroxiredoxin